MTAPVTASTVISPVAVVTVMPVVTGIAVPVWPAKIAKRWINADGHHPRRVVDSLLRWSVVIPRCRRVLRLDHLLASVRPRSRSHAECNDRQPKHSQFLPHHRYSSSSPRLNLALTTKLQIQQSLFASTV